MLLFLLNLLKSIIEPLSNLAEQGPNFSNPWFVLMILKEHVECRNVNRSITRTIFLIFNFIKFIFLKKKQTFIAFIMKFEIV
jgi:hypothetical protein